jgi:5-methyltetrahydrofolate--homocysteine methyltransferase
MSGELSTAILELDGKRVEPMVRSRLEQGEDPLRILDECREGMSLVGDRFRGGEYFLSELLLSAELFKEVTAILEPHLSAARGPEPLGVVLLATMQGDIHDLGKNIVATLLRVQGFQVHDLGVDVTPEQLVESAREVQPDVVGFSALITTAFESMKRASEMLVEAGLRDRIKLVIGGGVTSPALGDYLGADFQTGEATEGVAYCLKVIEGS